MFASRYGLPKTEGSQLFDLIGEQMAAAMDAGGTVKVFGIGALKVVKKRGDSGETRMRFRPRKSKDAQAEAIA
jgi:nucleoid DNA-binding protein